MKESLSIRVHNLETGEILDRQMTENEISQREIDLAAAALEIKTKKEVAAAKTALLARLGITEDEARLLLS